jgi:hypothetical protein
MSVPAFPVGDRNGSRNRICGPVEHEEFTVALDRNKHLVRVRIDRDTRRVFSYRKLFRGGMDVSSRILNVSANDRLRISRADREGLPCPHARENPCKISRVDSFRSSVIQYLRSATDWRSCRHRRPFIRIFPGNAQAALRCLFACPLRFYSLPYIAVEILSCPAGAGNEETGR